MALRLRKKTTKLQNNKNDASNWRIMRLVTSHWITALPQNCSVLLYLCCFLLSAWTYIPPLSGYRPSVHSPRPNTNVIPHWWRHSWCSVCHAASVSFPSPRSRKGGESPRSGLCIWPGQSWVLVKFRSSTFKQVLTMDMICCREYTLWGMFQRVWRWLGKEGLGQTTLKHLTVCVCLLSMYCQLKFFNKGSRM